ncbi:hypothetical protein MRX96_007799 [Rhipicephalus microplus]
MTLLFLAAVVVSTVAIGQLAARNADTPVHADDAEAQLVEQEGERGTSFMVHGDNREPTVDVHAAAAGKSDAVPPRDTKSSAGMDAADHASQSNGEAAKATDGTSKSVDPREHKNGIMVTGKHTEHQESSSKPKHAVTLDRVSGEHAVAITTKTADDKPIAKKSASTAAVHKAIGTRSKNHEDHASKGGAAGEHEKHEGKHDEQRGTPEKTAGAAVAEQPSSDEKSSPVPPSHASPTGDANAHPPAVDHQPGSGGTGRNVPAAPSSSGSAHSVNQEEEVLRNFSALFRFLARFRRGLVIL